MIDLALTHLLSLAYEPSERKTGQLSWCFSATRAVDLSRKAPCPPAGNPAFLLTEPAVTIQAANRSHDLVARKISPTALLEPVGFGKRESFGFYITSDGP
jgi:hypothetical protein